MEVRTIHNGYLNKWLESRHYLHRCIIRSKMLGHGIFDGNKLIGGILWATPHFTKKNGLFGMPDTLSKWEVLMLARFYLESDSGLTASEVLSESIGKAGRGRRGSKRRGWRLQEDWVKQYPPRFPDEPFVPRLLISWSDEALSEIEECQVCGKHHNGQHKGTIYKASGWEMWDTTRNTRERSAKARAIQGKPSMDGNKTCWIMRLGENPRAEELGKNIPRQLVMDLGQGA